MLTLLESAQVGLGRQEEIVGYVRELQGALDFGDMNAKTNIARRFSRPLKEATKFLRDVRSDIKAVKKIINQADKIADLVSKVEMKLEGFKTTATLRSSERQAISELLKITEKTLQYEDKLSTNLTGGNGPANSTSGIYQSFIKNQTSDYGSSINGMSMQPNMGTPNQPTQYDDIPTINTAPMQQQEHVTPDPAPVVMKEEHENSIIPHTDVFEDDFTPSMKATDNPVNKTVGMLNYDAAIASAQKRKAGGNTIMCLKPGTEDYYLAHKYDDGTIDHNHPSLPLVATIAGAKHDVDTMRSKTKLGETYDIEFVENIPDDISEQWETQRAKEKILAAKK